jgi:hypothetical protein
MARRHLKDLETLLARQEAIRQEAITIEMERRGNPTLKLGRELLEIMRKARDLGRAQVQRLENKPKV